MSKTDKENGLQEKYKDEFQAFAIDRFNISPELVSEFMNTFTTNLHNVRFAYFTAREHSQAEVTSLKAELEKAREIMKRFQFAHDLAGKKMEYIGVSIDVDEFLKTKEGE